MKVVFDKEGNFANVIDVDGQSMDVWDDGLYTYVFTDGDSVGFNHDELVRFISILHKISSVRQERCEMLTGFLVGPDGDPGDEIWCESKAEAVVDGVKVCGSCFLRMYLDDPDLVENSARIEK